MADLVVDVVDCVRNSAPLLLLTAGSAGYLLVRLTRRVGFRPTPIRLRWPWPRRTQRIGRRVVVPVRRHRRPETIGGIKQW